MTAARRLRGSSAFRRIPAALVFAAACAGAGFAATTEQIVSDWRSGLAIHGFDPVAYFADGKALAGRPEIELPFAGVVWRFRNHGNRGGFRDRPDVYMPRFGGHDPIVLARGVAAPGHPQVWAINGERLYLFHGVENRDRFTANPARAIAAAEAQWPAVSQTLVP